MSATTGTQAELLYAMPASGNAVSGVSTTGTFTSLLLSQPNTGTAPAYALASYFFPNTYGVGRSLMIQGGGTYNTGSTTETLTFNVYFDTIVGSTSAGVKIAGTGAMTGFQQTSQTNWGWMFDVLLTCTAVGPSATVNAIGKFHIGPANNAATASSSTVDYLIGGPSATINTSTSYFIDVFAWFGATTASQNMTMNNFLVWGLN